MKPKIKIINTSQYATKEISTAVVVKGLEKEAQPYFKKLRAVSSIKTKEDYAIVSKNASQLKEIGKIAKAKEDSIVNPIMKGIKEIKALFKPFKDQVYVAEANAKTMLLEYQNKLEEDRAKLTEDFKDGKIKKASTVVDKMAELDVDDESSSVRKIWRAVCVDESKTPREYLVPDEAKIKEALKAGKKVPGWVWKQNKTIAI